MADRQFHNTPNTQGARHVWMPIKVLPNGTGVPTIGEGDPNQSYLSITRTGTGAFTLKTKDPYVALVNIFIGVRAVTQAPWSASGALAVKNADNTISIPFTIYNAGVAADLNAGVAAGAGVIDITVVLRNSNVVP